MVYAVVLEKEADSPAQIASAGIGPGLFAVDASPCYSQWLDACLHLPPLSSPRAPRSFVVAHPSCLSSLWFVSVYRICYTR